MEITSDHRWRVDTVEDLRAWREAGYPGKVRLTDEMGRLVAEAGADG
jgi:hypothetical protein